MFNRAFASLVPRVQASVPGCPHATIVQYIRDSAIRTCERTLAWRYQIPQFFLVPGKHECVYNSPGDTDVHALFGISVNGVLLKPLILEQAISLFPELAEKYIYEGPSQFGSQTPAILGLPEYNEVQYNGHGVFAVAGVIPANCGTYVVPTEIKVKTGFPRYVTQLTPDKYIILPAPDNLHEYKCSMYVALKPKHDATGMDSVMFDELEEVIMHGALQHLLVLPKQVWSDRELAAYHAKQYAYQIAERRARANLGNMRGTIRVRMQPFVC